MGSILIESLVAVDKLIEFINFADQILMDESIRVISQDTLKLIQKCYTIDNLDRLITYILHRLIDSSTSEPEESLHEYILK
jgi:hypothetical protein